VTALAQFYRRLIFEGPSSLLEKALFLVLSIVSRLYGLLMLLRAWAYGNRILHRHKAGIPVISVGNLTVGGTGKTPVVDELIRRSLAAGKRVAVVSRGYGGRRKADTAVVADGRGEVDDQPDLYGDEPVLLARRNPQAVVIVARRRRQGVELAEKLGAELAILDDGFQHLALERDLDILLLDAVRPFGNHRVLPAGSLREPRTALQRCDLVILTRAEAESHIDLPVARPLLRCRHVLSEQLQTLDGHILGWEELRGKACLAFAGIARPEDFFAALRRRGVDLQGEVFFSDHQEYGLEALKRLHQACNNCELMITTEKDAVKLHAADLPVPCCHGGLELEFFDTTPLDVALDQLNGRKQDVAAE